LTNDNCGNCVTFQNNTGWCSLTNACYNIPADCPLPENHNCQTGECICPQGFSWCQSSRSCVKIPDCCATYDNCGTCLTFNEGTAWCNITNACYNIPAECPALTAHNCETGKCICAANQTWCAQSASCVDIPVCCLTNDNCGKCLTFKQGTGWCNITNACYSIPADCPNNHNCETGACICPESQTWCADLKACIAVPDCCETSDNCGRCLTFKNGTAYCEASNACYNIPAACPELGAHDCTTGQCICAQGQVFCSQSSSCVTIPDCCATYDNCGNCLTVKEGFVYFNNTCMPIRDIPRCITYAPDHQTCQACDVNAELYNDGQWCRIVNCTNYNPTNDTCIQCADGYVPTSDNKACLPIVRQCESYDNSTMHDSSLGCLQCSFPYSLVNGQCIIPRCLEQNLTTPDITCDQCLSNDARSPDKRICYPPIEKCLSYFFLEPSGYGCDQCEFLFETNPEKSLCVAASFNIMGWSSGASAAGNYTDYLLAMSLQAHQLAWMEYFEEMSASWSILWYIQGYLNNTYFTIRTIVTEFDSIVGQNVERAYYAVASGTSLILQPGFTSQGIFNEAPVPTLNLQWVFHQAFENNTLVFTIQYDQSNLYLNYNLTLSERHEYFYLR